MPIQVGAKGLTLAGVQYAPHTYIDWLSRSDESLATQGGDAVEVPPRRLAPAQVQAYNGTDFGPVVVFEGDSRTSQGQDASQGFTSYGYGSWVRALAQCRPTTVNLAVAGNTALQMAARVSEVAALRPFAVVMRCGVNDIAGGGAGAGALSAARQIEQAKAHIQAGARYVLMLLETGYVGWTGVPAGEMLALNRALIAFASTNRNVRIVHTLDLVVDYTAATQVPITYKAGVFADGQTHDSVNLAYQVGLRVAALLDSLWGGAEPAPFLMPGDTSNLLVNPNFATTAAVAGWAGWSGTYPTSWFGYQSGTATVVCAVQANPAYGGVREVQLTITTSGAGNVQFWQEPIAGLVANDNIVGAAELEVVGTPVNLRNAQPNLFTNIGGVTKYGWPLFYTAGFDPSPPSSSWPQVAMVQRSPETSVVPIGAGTQTNLRFTGIFAEFGGAGSATIRMRKARVNRVPAGYRS